VSAKPVVANLRTVADRVGLAPCSVSAILNRTPAARAIPKHTQDRVFRAATELNYQPNISARSLRTKRTQMIALLSNDFARADVGSLVSRTERALRERGYLLVLGSLDQPSEWPRLAVLLRQRGVEGLIAVDVPTLRELSMPAVCLRLRSLTAKEASAESSISEMAESAIAALLSKIDNRVTAKPHPLPTPSPAYGRAPNANPVAALELD
jgi:DNA-binding LacI/PurR family transcriptional regulator